MGKRLYVGNLSFHTTDSTIQQYFSQAGAVESVTLLVDKFTGRSRGIAFVEMATETDAQAAISQYDGKEFEGRPLKVNEARPREERAPSGFGGGGGDRGERRGGRRDY
jgi:RNA recognition motif-containing protein